MRLALIFPPFSYKLHEENLRIVVKYFGMFPPMSISWAASIAEKAGHEVIIVDARVLRLTKEDVLDRLRGCLRRRSSGPDEAGSTVDASNNDSSEMIQFMELMLDPLSLDTLSIV